MSYKVAVASSDGKFVNQHFGMAQQFLIFEIDDDEYKFMELRRMLRPVMWKDTPKMP
ncbi:MAG TPA: NifB/NifX family molybdenum-iron cluster-binding protein [Methanobacterium sp.]